MKSKIHLNILNARKEAKLTQAEMAERMGMSLTAYGNFERGKTKLDSERIETFSHEVGKCFSKIVLGYETIEGEASNLEEYRSREDKLKELLEQANNRISDLEMKVKTLEERNVAKDHTIKVLEDIRRLYENELKIND